MAWVALPDRAVPRAHRGKRRANRTPVTLERGEIVDDRYRILSPIGEGGMGTVYLAENVRIDRRVAIKVLHAHLVSMEDVVARFEREARAAARIGSPHIADVIDLGFLPSGEPFVIMEYLEGESLWARLKARGRIAAKEMAPIVIQLLDGLSEVHKAGIVHRDLKPGNIFLMAAKEGDFVKILDFGVSKFRTGLFSGPDAITSQEDMLGTPAYMAPEHVKGDEVDARADLYSVGAVLYRCVSGFQPFASDNYLELLLKITNEPPRPIEALAPEVDPGFAAILRKAMARAPSDRYQTAAELREAIVEWHGRIDRILAEFLGLRHAAGALARRETPAKPRAAVSAPRQRLVSKVVVEPGELAPSTPPDPITPESPRMVPPMIGDEQLDDMLDALLDGPDAHRGEDP